VAETILIVDDEELVRRTFREWLQGADPDCELVEAWDAESALQIASQRSIDLAILDWNLGAGNNGLQLLEDLRVFCPEVVAILVTGYAHQATPLDALRMGVRDYLDKNRDLRRETLLAVVRRQLEQIRPAKRERQHLERVRQFQQALEAIVPLVQTTSDLSSGIAPSESLRALLQFAQDIFETRHGVLLVRHSKMEASNASSDSPAVRAQGNSDRAHVPDFSVDLFDMEGRRLETPNVPFAETLAATALAMQEVCVLANLKEMVPPGVTLQPYELAHENVVVVPVPLEPPRAAVLEVFDTPLGRRELGTRERTLVRHFQELARAVLEQLLAERQLHAAVWRALHVALQAGTAASPKSVTVAAQPAVWAHLQQAIQQPELFPENPRELVELAWQLRELLRRYGPPALQFCRQLLDQLEQLLSRVLELPDGTRQTSGN
jgi:two-component system nitrogen regulation response regulator NtrX